MGLPIFLGAATLLQIAFLFVGFKKLYEDKASAATQSKAVALIALAFADFVWAFACFVQCVMTKSQGSFAGGADGCNVQGYYSVLACFSTMFFTMQMTHITHIQVSEGSAALPTKGKMVLSSVGLYGFAMLISAIPFLPSTGSFVYTAEGFCFIDYYDGAINTVFLLSMLISMGHVWYKTFQTQAALQAKHADGNKSGAIITAAPPSSVFAFAVCFTLYYVCGFPLVVQGYKGASYTNKLQIASGLLAHGAELINPFLYGIFWCKWFMADDVVLGETKTDGVVAGVAGITNRRTVAGISPTSVTSSLSWGSAVDNNDNTTNYSKGAINLAGTAV